MKIRIALVLLAVSLAPNIAFAQPPDKATEVAPDLTTPEKTVRGFVDAVEKHKFPILWKYVLDAKPSQQMSPEYQRAIINAAFQIKVERVDTTQEGNWAYVNLHSQITAFENPQPHTASASSLLLLFQRNGAWQIVPASPQVISDLDFNFVLQQATLLVHPEALEIMHQDALARSSLSRLRQIGVATAQSVQDNDEKLVLRVENYPEQLKPYIVNDAIYDLPNVEPKKQYAFNGNLSGIIFEDIKQLTKTIMFYTGQNGELDFVYQDQAAVLFADGHAALVSREEAKDLRWKP